MTKLIKFIEENTKGTDYICSDIHGHFSLLEQLLDIKNFNTTTDRLFSLGDLIDRGYESDQTLKWLAYDWFYAIQGNHERMLINAVEQKSSQLFAQWYAWGGDWAEDFDQYQLEQYYLALSSLPVAIELQLGDGKKVGLVHAELPDKCNWDDVTTLLKREQTENIERNQLTSDMLWKKSQIYRDVDGILSIEPVSNINHVFHGHTIVDQITTYANRTFMDLGSYLNGDIGLIKPTDYV